MQLRTLLNTALLLLLALALGGCLDNNNATNPNQPSTAFGPAAPVTTTPASPSANQTPTGFRAVTSGRNHSCIIKNSDNSLWCWGSNSAGQVGINNSTDANTFQNIGQTYLWQSISGGYTHTCGAAILEVPDPANTSHKYQLHQLLCWGDNSTGAIGYGNTATAYYQPVALQDDDWSVVSAGNNHTCAIRLDNTLWCWGDDTNGQLGLGSVSNTHVFLPAQVNSGTDWSSISASDQFTCALKMNHTLWCWGKNDKSQFGNGTTSNATTPLQIGTATDWKAIATGEAHVCALKLDNTLWCWGDNSFGQIGNNSVTPQPSPVQISAGSITTWSAVATGFQHTCAIAINIDQKGNPLTDDKTLWCWGNNQTGQLGINTTANQASPVKVSHATGWLMVSAGESHTCAVDKNQISSCWGFNNHGQLANGFNTNTDLPRLFDTSSDWSSIASGYSHSCGLKGSSAPYTLWCGGFNSYGQLGIGSASGQAAMVQISANSNNTIISDWTALSTGPNHTCAIAINGTLFCWGDNSSGQLGQTTILSNAPQNWWPSSSSQVIVGADDWSMVATGANNSCGIKGAGQLWCWGDNSSGQKGNNSISATFLPTQITTGSWLTVAVGGPVSGTGGHICAIKVGNTLWCWGKNDKYQLGNNSTTDSATPIHIGPDIDWVAVKAGERHTCARTSNGAIWCWGDNSSGQTASPAATVAGATVIPTQEANNGTWLDFDTGSDFTCAIKNDNTLWCWGNNLYKQLTGNITTATSFVPKQADNNPGWLQLALGQQHGCAIRQNPGNSGRYTYCWGTASPYQFGDGSAWKTTPQPLSLQ